MTPDEWLVAYRTAWIEGDLRGSYSAVASGLLLEREGRLDEAIERWRSIVAWNEERGDRLAAEYPKSELEPVNRTGGKFLWDYSVHDVG